MPNGNVLGEGVVTIGYDTYQQRVEEAWRREKPILRVERVGEKTFFLGSEKRSQLRDYLKKHGGRRECSMIGARSRGHLGM